MNAQNCLLLSDNWFEHVKSALNQKKKEKEILYGFNFDNEVPKQEKLKWEVIYDNEKIKKNDN